MAKKSEDLYSFGDKTNKTGRLMTNIILWNEWSKAFSSLRIAFSRQSTFMWAAVFCAGIAIRPDTRGVSSIVAVLGLNARSYSRLVNLCHSSAIKLDILLSCWIGLCFRLFEPVCVDGHLVLFGDGINIPLKILNEFISA